MTTLFKRKGFTLIEIAAVMILSSLLLIALTKGIIGKKSIIKDVRLKQAKALTKNSPIYHMNDLVIWYENSLDESFEASEAVEDGNVSIWYNIAPNYYYKNNATQSTVDYQPKYRKDSFNGLPSIEFDGLNHYMPLNLDYLVESSYTIFVVASRSSVGTEDFFLAGEGSWTGKNLHLGHRSGSAITLAHFGSDINYYTDSKWSTNKLYIHSFYFSLSSDIRKIYLNKELKVSQYKPDALLSDNRYNIGRIRASNDARNNCHCTISEIIIFSRALGNEEINDVHNYLGKKYQISLE